MRGFPVNQSGWDIPEQRPPASGVSTVAIMGAALCMMLAAGGCTDSGDVRPPSSVTTEPVVPTTGPAVQTTERTPQVRKPEPTTEQPTQTVGGDILPTTRADPLPSSRPDVNETTGLPEPVVPPVPPNPTTLPEPTPTLPTPPTPIPIPTLPEPIPTPTPTLPEPIPGGTR